MAEDDRDIAEPVLDQEKAPRRTRVSAVWLVPLVALVISLGVAWQTYSARGPLIEIVFDNAAGIEAGQTPIRFRDVTVGRVERIGFSEDLARVVVSARLNNDIAPFVDDSAQFWVVRPQVTAQGVTGLDTVISGVYIAAWWDGQRGDPVARYTGLDAPPLTPADQPGTRVRLRAPDGGSINVGAPVFFRRIQVGTVETKELTPEGDVVMDVFVDAPHDQRLTTATRFWDISGFSLEIGAQGASLNIDSLISIVQGGVAFDTVTTGGEPAVAGQEFRLFPSETAARDSIFDADETELVRVDVFFDGSVRGLSVGAPVELRGIRVGEVEALQATVVPIAGIPTVSVRTTLVLQPRRLGLLDADGDLQAQALDLLAARVEQGLRAELALQNLFTGALYVNLTEALDEEPTEARLDLDAEPRPVLPAAPVVVDRFAASAEGVLDRVAALPVEELLEAGIALLDNVNLLITDDGVRTAPENLGLLLADLRALVAQPAVQDTPAEIAATVAALRGLVEALAAEELVEGLALTLDETRAAVGNINVASARLPALVDNLIRLSDELAALPTEDLLRAATELVATMDAYVQSEPVTELPRAFTEALATLNDTLDAVRAFVEDPALQRTPAELNALIAGARGLVDQATEEELVRSIAATLREAETAAADVAAASAEFPALVARLSALADQAAALPAEELLLSGTRLIAQIEAYLNSDELAAVPASLNAAVIDARLLLGELRGLVQQPAVQSAPADLQAAILGVQALIDSMQEAQLVATLAEALEEARRAAANVSTASDELPMLIGSLNALTDEVRAMPIESVVVAASSLLTEIEILIRSDDVAELPASVTGALEEARLMLEALREGGAVENVNAALASAEAAARAIALGAEDLPALIAQLSAVASRADQVLTTVTPGSEINRETLVAIREIRDAARALGSLALALERRPNSILFGR